MTNRQFRFLSLAGALSVFGSGAGRPPHEAGPCRPGKLVELPRLKPSIRVDIRYATTHDFMGRMLCSWARTFLQGPAAEALAQVRAQRQPLGYGLLVFDGYRPWRITKQMWNRTPAGKREFVAAPREARDLLRARIAARGFAVLPAEWWHFDFRDWKAYPIQGVPIERLWGAVFLRMKIISP